MFKGTVIAQFIGFLGTLLLAKLYGSDAFGLLGVYISIVSVLQVLYTLQLEHSIINSTNKLEIQRILGYTILIVPLLTIFCYIIFTLISFIIHIEPTYIITISIAIIISLIYALNKLNEAYFTFFSKFKHLANGKILLTFFTIASQLLLYKFLHFYGLIIGNAIGVVILYIYYAVYSENVKIYFSKHFLKSRTSIIKHILPSTLINTLAINLVPILIVSLFSLTETGVYFLSLKILSLPVFIISSSISQVFYQKTVKIYQFAPHKLFSFTKRIVFTNSIIIGLFLVFVNTIGVIILETFLDKNWQNLRIYIFILSFLIFSKTLFSPISDIVVVIKKMKLYLFFNIYLVFITFFSFFIGYKTNSFITSLVVLSTLTSIGYCYIIILIFKSIKRYKNNYSSKFRSF